MSCLGAVMASSAAASGPLTLQVLSSTVRWFLAKYYEYSRFQ